MCILCVGMSQMPAVVVSCMLRSPYTTKIAILRIKLSLLSHTRCQRHTWISLFPCRSRSRDCLPVKLHMWLGKGGGPTRTCGLQDVLQLGGQLDDMGWGPGPEDKTVSLIPEARFNLGVLQS